MAAPITPPSLPTVGALAADLLKYRGTFDPGAVAAGFEREWLRTRRLPRERLEAQKNIRLGAAWGQPIELTERELEAWFHVDRHARKPVIDFLRARACRIKCYRNVVYNAKRVRRFLCRGKCEPSPQINDNMKALNIHHQARNKKTQPPILNLKAKAGCAIYKASAIALSSHIIIALTAIISVVLTGSGGDNLALLMQMGFIFAIVAALLMNHQLVGAFEDIFENHLSNPIIPLPDSVSLEMQVDETDHDSENGFIKARLLLRHRLWVEDTTFDASIMRLVVVNRESFPGPALCRRGIQIVTSPESDANVERAVHTLRILIAAALSRLECAMYDVACGYREDTDRDRKKAIGLSPRSKRMEDRRAALLKTDRAMANLDAWRFASLASKPLSLIESEKVEQYRVQNQFKIDRRFAALQNTSFDEMVVFFHNLVLRLIFNAVEESQITPTTEFFTDENNLEEAISEEDRRAQSSKLVLDNQSNGRTTTIRLLPSLQHALALPSKVFKDVLLQFREYILQMAQLLCDQLNLVPDMHVQKVSLLDSLLADTEGAISEDSPLSTGLTAADLHRKMQKMSPTEQMNVSFKRGKVVDWLVDWVWEHAFDKVVDLLSCSYVPDSQQGLPYSDEIVRHITCVYYRVYEDGLRETLWRDIDQRFLSTFPPFRLNENFRGYFDRMGIKMISDTDVYGDEKEKMKTEMRDARRKGIVSKSTPLPDMRQQLEWKRMLSVYYQNANRTLTDFDETSSIPVTSLGRILTDGAADFVTVAGSSVLSRRVSGVPVSVNLISIQNMTFAIGKAQEISAMFLPLLLLAERTPTQISYLVHNVYPEWHGPSVTDDGAALWNVWRTGWRLLASAFIGVPLDMRDPSSVSLAIVISNALAFLLFVVLAIIVARLWVSESPWLRTFYTSLSAIERRWTIEKRVQVKHWAWSSTSDMLPGCLRKSRSPLVLKTRDFLHSTAYFARWLSGASWSIVMDRTVGDLVALDTRPPQARNIVHAAKLTKALSVLCVVGEVALLSLVAGASLSTRCVSCSNSLQINPIRSPMITPDTGHKDGHMQWAGIAICGGSGVQYAMASVSLIFLTPLLIVMTSSIAIFPSILRLHDFSTRAAGAGKHWPAGLNAGVSTSIFSDGLLWAKPRNASFRVAAKCVLVSTVVIHSESNIVLSIGIVLLYTLCCHLGPSLDVLCWRRRSLRGSIKKSRRNAYCNLCLSIFVGAFILVLTLTTEPNASQQIYGARPGVNLTHNASGNPPSPVASVAQVSTDISEEFAFSPTLLPSCEFDDGECAWEASGQVAFKRKTHPVTKSKAALAREAKAAEKTGGTAAAVESDEPTIVDRYLESGTPTTKECLTTCEDVFWAFLDVKNPFSLDPSGERTCMRFDYRIRLGDNVDKPQSGFVAVYQESRDKSRWIPLWNITSSNSGSLKQAVPQDWRSTGRIFLDNKESPTRIRVETALVGGGSDCSIDSMDFGCVDPGPAAPEWPALIASCWDDGHSLGNETFLGGLTTLFTMTVLFILWRSLWARRVGAHLLRPLPRRTSKAEIDMAVNAVASMQTSQKQYAEHEYMIRRSNVGPEIKAAVSRLIDAVVYENQDVPNDDHSTIQIRGDTPCSSKNQGRGNESQETKFWHKVNFTVQMRSNVKKRIVTPQLPENIPLVHRNPTIPSNFNPLPKQRMLSLSFRSIEAKSTSSRLESLCRVSMFLPAETLSQPQKSYMIGASAEVEGRVIQKRGVLYRRVNIYDCPITLNACTHKWTLEENPSFGFSSTEEMVAAEFVVWVGPAFWFRTSEKLESNATSSNGAVSIRFNLRDLMIRNAEQEWLNDNEFVFLPRSNSGLEGNESQTLRVKASQENLAKRNAFLERASTQVWDVAKTLIIGDPNVSHLRLGIHLDSTALLRPALEQMLCAKYEQRRFCSQYFCSPLVEMKLQVCDARISVINRHKCLNFTVLTSSLKLSRHLCEDGKNGVLDEILTRTLRVSTGQPVVVKHVSIEEIHSELSCFQRWTCCHYSGRDYPEHSDVEELRRRRSLRSLRNFFCFAKLVVTIGRLLEFCTTCVCEGLLNIFRCTTTSVMRCFRFVTKREISVGLDPNRVWPDGGKSPSRVRPNMRMLVQHKFYGGKINEGGLLSKGPERTLFTFREATVKQVPLAGGHGKVLVTYDAVGELADEWVHISQLREPESGVKILHGAKYRAKTSVAASETTPQDLSEWHGYNWGGYSSEEEDA